MAQTIKIKRSTTTAAPSSLTAGELAYSDNSDKLFIGAPADNAVVAIGGKVYVDMLDHTAGTLTASSAIIVDADSKIDKLLTGNIQINDTANQIDTSSGNLILAPAANLKINAGTVDLSAQATQLSLVDNSATALTIAEGSNTYMSFITTNSGEKITTGKTLVVDGDGTTGNGGVTIENGTIDLKNGGGNDSRIRFYCSSSNAHFQTLQAAPHSASASNTLLLPAAGTELISNTATQTMTNKSLTSPTLTGTTTAAAANFSGTITGPGGSSSGVSITQGAIAIKNGGTQSRIDFYCEVSNAHYARLQAPAHSAFSGNVTITLPAATTTLVGTDTTQTLTNKTLTSPDINTPDIDGGAIDGATIGGNTPAAGTFTTLAGNSLAVDNVSVDTNTISTTNSNGDLVLSPNGTGTVTVPSGYKNRAGFGANSLVSKEYVDAVKVGLDFKDSVRVASTANVTVSGPGTAIDGITLSSGDRVLLKDQSTASENGIYVFNGSASAMTRATDADSSTEVTSGLFTFVEEGTVNADNGFVLTTDGSITVGSTSLSFVQFSGAGQITAGDALTKTGNQFDVNDDNITLEVNSDALRIKGISATAVGDLLIGAASNAGYTRLVKPSGNATAHDYVLSMNTSGAAQWSNILDGGTF
tara:strand:+ start:2028 stop:3959 length:1932 start_codon:yes stop_codon:yes gene_type:complete